MRFKIAEDALAKLNGPEREPVATMWQHSETGRTRITMPGDITDCDARWFKAADLYTSPQPSKPWVGLTHADFDWLEQMFGSSVSNDFVFADIVCVIEAKLKEKNT